jgi:oxaloacetate decarboxylase beta subunit
MFPYYIDNAIMIAVGLVLCTLAIVKRYEPLLLLPIGFGAIIVNIPGSGLMDPGSSLLEGGFLRILYETGIATEIFPILIFIAIGAMCDFGALIERPWLMIFAAAGQIGIFVALLCALAIGFAPLEAASIGIIGAMDGPTAIYVTSQFAPSMLGAITVCAYSYMSMVPIFQVPISRALTTRKERMTRMKYKPAAYPKIVRLIFPII